jgi:hypothetical protein
MASKQQLEDALIAAHEAGDTEAAQVFANEIKNYGMPAKPADPSLYNQDDERQKAGLRKLREGWRQIGLTGRTIMDTFAGPPLAAMDAGVAGRNVLTGGNYQMPSQMWNEALNSAGVPQPQNMTEKGVNIAGQVLLGSKMPAPQVSRPAPAAFNPQTLKQMAFAKARKEGYVAPPSTVNPSTLNKTLESIGGKLAMEQDASIRSQSVTDALMKRAVGLDDAAQVSEDVLPGLRTQAAGAYKALRNVGTMRADAKYSQALDDIAKQYRGAAKDFPGLARDDILQAVEAVKKPSFDADSALDAIAIMRDKASTAYTQGDKALGKAYREISGAMEGAIERSLARRGKDSAQLLKEFREARQLIAKTYTAEKALNPQVGSFNATKLATDLAKGKPLSGEMKKVAEFAQAFPKAAKLVLDSGSVRNTDVILGAGTAALSKEPSYLLYPFLRQAVRHGLLSDVGQRVLTQPGIRPMPQTAMGLAYGAQGLLGQ